VIRNGLYYGLMESPIGRNAINWLLHFDFPCELLRNVKLNEELILNRFKTCSLPETVAHAAILKELVMIRDRCLILPQSSFSHEDIVFNFFLFFLLCTNAYMQAE
jgi:hypothetical protein